MYADDLKLSWEINGSSDYQILQHCLDQLARWGSLNNLKLNPTKCQMITFSRSRSLISHHVYHLDDVVLPRATEVKDLGVLLDEQLNFRQHYDRTIAKARITLGLVKRFSKEFSDQRVSKTLYCSLVQPILEYAVPVWTPYHATHLARLESVQKQFLLFVLGRQRLPGSYALPPYRERLAVLRLDRISDHHKVACDTLIFDLLMRGIDCR